MKRYPYFASSSCAQGFTLIEMVITIVLIGILAGILAPLLNTLVTGFFDTRARTELTADARVLLDRLSREIREADPATIQVTTPNQLQFTQLQGLNSLVEQGTEIVKTYQACRTVIISQSGNNLNWDENADSTVDAVLASKLSNITFQYNLGNTIRSGVVTIELTLSEDNNSITVYREVHIRNTLGSVQCI